MPQIETPEQLCHRFAREIRACLRHFNRTQLRYSENLDGLKITVGANRTKETVDESPDLPFELRLSRPATRDVYRVLVALRSEKGESACVMPKDIMDRQAIHDPKTEPSRDTVNHALRELHDRKLAWSHPDRGWVLGRDRHELPGLESERVPVFAGHSDSASSRKNIAYASPAAHDSRARTSGGWSLRQYIWVPAEEIEGVCFVTDAANGRSFPCNEHIKEITYETTTGRVKTVPAVRGELVGTEGKRASVKIQGGHEVTVKILGDWHLAGERSAPADAHESTSA